MDGIIGERKGTIMSIDFQNAFRSTSLRWFNLVMERIGIPREYINWFWTMYRNLGIKIVVNGYMSDRLQVKRGFMEGLRTSSKYGSVCDYYDTFDE